MSQYQREPTNDPDYKGPFCLHKSWLDLFAELTADCERLAAERRTSTEETDALLKLVARLHLLPSDHDDTSVEISIRATDRSHWKGLQVSGEVMNLYSGERIPSPQGGESVEYEILNAVAGSGNNRQHEDPGEVREELEHWLSDWRALCSEEGSELRVHDDEPWSTPADSEDDEKQLAEMLQDIVIRYDQSDLRISNAFEDGGLDPLWPRFERAAMNQIEDGDASIRRYAIWANTVRDNIVDAIRLLEVGNEQSAHDRLVRAANSLSAFTEVQALVDPLKDPQDQS